MATLCCFSLGPSRRRSGPRSLTTSSISRASNSTSRHSSDRSKADLTTLAGGLDPDDCASKLADALVGLAPDPEDVALPVGSTRIHRRCITCAPSNSGGPAKAHAEATPGGPHEFSVDSEVDMASVSAPSTNTVHTKVLWAVGQLPSHPMGRVLDLAVDGSYALPGDPMWAAWSRRRPPRVLLLDQAIVFPLFRGR